MVFVNPADLASRGIEPGDKVDIETAIVDGQLRHLSGFTAVDYNIASGSIGAYYPEANRLVSLSYHDPESGTPSYKSVPVRIRRMRGV